MTRNSALTSEIARLERMISRIPESDVIERAAFEERLEIAREEYVRLGAVPEPERTRVTFRGSPVTDSSGMKADFGGKATLAFSDAFAAVVAGKKEKLKFMGPIPEKARTQLMITGTVTGSFGFEFQLPNLPKDYFPGGDGPGASLERLFEILRLSADGSDEEVADVIADMHPRAVRKVAEFLGLMADSQAWCSLEFRQKVFRYRNSDHLKKSVDRLSSENIKEDLLDFRGELQGVLPRQRTFEFKAFDDGSVIKGKVGHLIDDVGVLNKEFLHRPLVIRLTVVQVGQGRPRYFLNEIKDIRTF